MSTLKNSVRLIGRLGNDPEVKTFDSGKKRASFSMATNDSYYNNSGEKVTDTQWHNIVAWDKRAETVAEFLKKGSEIAVEGKLVNRKYDKEGETKFITEVSLNEMRMFGKKED